MMTEITQEEKDTKEVLREYKSLLRAAKSIMKDGDIKVIRKAFETAAEAHNGMRRKSGEPYILHPIAVARICVDEIGLGTTSIVAALLHDVVEDTDITLEDIEKSFGRKVARIIDGLTKISGAFEDDESKVAANLQKIVLTLSDDVRVIFIKIADRLHNMRTMGSMPKHKQLHKSSETLYMYAPLAHRLGLYNIKSELEELYLKYTEPEAWEEIRLKIEESAEERLEFIRDFIAPFQKELRKNMYEFSIKGRTKSIYSIWKKMKKQNIPFEQVYDLFAIRVTLNVPEENEKTACWQVYSVVTDYYRPNPDRLRDWISTPKANGYESLHTTVMSNKGKWVEVQIRTERMNDISERGYAAHWKYKKEGSNDPGVGIELWIEKVRDMLQQTGSSPKEFIDDFRTNLFNEEIFVFTPKGDLKVFPRGATILDMAFEVHSDLGIHCVGAKVNHQLVPVNHELKNGDQVEIITSKSQDPTFEWLKVTTTSRAQKQIKEHLNDKKRRIEAKGKDILTDKLKNFSIEISNNFENRMTNLFQATTPREVYYRIGSGQIDLSRVKRVEDLRKIVPRKRVVKSDESLNSIEKLKELKNNTLIVGGSEEELEYKACPHCYPVPGDDILGFLSQKDGLQIHRGKCEDITELLANYGHRVLKAEWDDAVTMSFNAPIKAIGMDRKGLLNEVTAAIYSINEINIVSLNARTNQELFEIRLEMGVSAVKELEDVIQVIGQIPDIFSVERIESQN